MIIKLHRASDGKTYTFGPEDITQSSASDDRSNALIAENLSIDTFTFTLKGRDSVFEPLMDSNNELIYDENDELIWVRSLSYATVDFSQYTKYEDWIEVWDDVLLSKFYVESVSTAGNRSGEMTFTCVSIMGVLDNMQTHGGMYVNAPVGDLISALMGAYTYTISGDLAATTLYGWIPAGTRRDALKQILFPTGASILKDVNGDPEFTYNLPQTVEIIPNTFIGGEIVENSEAASMVELTEHSFYASSAVDPTVIYDNSGGVAADHAEIIFDAPYHTLVGTGITIHESGANYAIISGTGTLTGIPYVHVQRVMNKTTDANAASNIKSYTDAYMVSPLNSERCLDRLANYYGQTAEISVSFQGGAQNPGSLISVVDPTDFSSTVMGYIKSIKRKFSKIIKADAKLTYNWVPKDVGNAYDSYLIVRKSDVSGGTWNVPAALQGKKVLIALFGGGQGGQGGWYGSGGDRHDGGSASSNNAYTLKTYRPSEAPVMGAVVKVNAGQEGGQGGQGGNIGKMLLFNVGSLASSYTVSMGTGGAGGNGGTVSRSISSSNVITITKVDPTDGSAGTDSTFGSYSTADGTNIGGDYVNMITGQVIAGKGEEGTKGGKGGDGGVSIAGLMDQNATYDYSVQGRGQKGEDVGIYTGGSPADGLTGANQRGYFNPGYDHVGLQGGGGGGGAALGSNGSNGSNNAVKHQATVGSDTVYAMGRMYNGTIYDASKGGDGADASTVPAQSDLYGGTGGPGGGGGGGGGQPIGNLHWANEVYGIAVEGLGGNGANGGQGSDGWFIVYYKAE